MKSTTYKRKKTTHQNSSINREKEQKGFRKQGRPELRERVRVGIIQIRLEGYRQKTKQSNNSKRAQPFLDRDAKPSGWGRINCEEKSQKRK